jgi:hypothetical protein
MQPRHIPIEFRPAGIAAIGMSRKDAQPRTDNQIPLHPSMPGFSRKVVARLGTQAFCVMLAFAGTVVNAQDSESTPTSVLSTAPVIPQQVRFSGSLPNRIGDTVEAVFRIYPAAEGGKPLWTETQRISVASDGSYNVLLGAASTKGLPQSVFGDGHARWVGVAVERGDEEVRIPLASAPYAMKAGDAETLGGLSVQSFVTHAQLAAVAQSIASQAVEQIAPSAAVTTSGTTNYLPLWTSSSTLGDSILYQVNSGPGNSIGIGTTTPSARVHIVGTGGTIPSLVVQGGGGLGVIKMGGDVNANTLTASVRKLARITMPDWAADSLGITLFSGDVTGVNSNDLYFGGTPGGSQYAATGLHFVTAANGTTSGGTEQMTLNSAGNFGIGTTAPAAKLEVNGTAKFDGNITFAPTQTFPVKGTGGGTITGVTAGAGLTGGGTSGTVSLGVDSSVVPLLTSANTFTGEQTISNTLVIETTDSSGYNAIFAAADSVPLGMSGGAGGLFEGGDVTPSGGTYSGIGGDGLEAFGGGDGGTQYGGDGGYFVGGDAAASGGDGLFAVGGYATNGDSVAYAGYFNGDVHVNGTLSAESKNFEIDHPQDPANKYLDHASVESSEMMNIYTGNVVTDQYGNAVVIGSSRSTQTSATSLRSSASLPRRLSPGRSRNINLPSAPTRHLPRSPGR